MGARHPNSELPEIAAYKLLNPKKRDALSTARLLVARSEVGHGMGQHRHPLSCAEQTTKAVTALAEVHRLSEESDKRRPNHRTARHRLRRAGWFIQADIQACDCKQWTAHGPIEFVICRLAFCRLRWGSASKHL